MWAKIGQVVITQVVIPLIKDLAFMLYNMFKVRQIRKAREAEAQAKVEEYKKDPSDENFGQLP